MTNRFWSACRAHLRRAPHLLALMLLAMGTASAATPRVDEAELLKLGFKVLVATTEVQQKWVRSLPAGKIRPMQRTGKKFYIYPDATRNQIYVGGPAEYDAYAKAHPEELRAARLAKDAAAKESARRGKDAAKLQAATARDLSDPFLGATWAELGW